MRVTSARVREVTDWRVEDYSFRAPSGTVVVNKVVPRFGGQQTTRSSLTYNFVNPRDNGTAIQMIKDFALSDALAALSANDLEKCIQTVRTLKAPQVKTMFWQKSSAGHLLKVYCGVNAVTEYIVVEDKDLNSAYWQVSKP